MWLVFGPPRTVNKRRLCGPLLGRRVHLSFAIPWSPFQITQDALRIGDSHSSKASAGSRLPSGFWGCWFGAAEPERGFSKSASGAPFRGRGEPCEPWGPQGAAGLVGGGNGLARWCGLAPSSRHQVSGNRRGKSTSSDLTGKRSETGPFSLAEARISSLSKSPSRVRAVRSPRPVMAAASPRAISPR